jgi:hypothetical protein
MQLSTTAITALLMAASLGSRLETEPTSLCGQGVINVTPSPQTLRDVAGDGGVKPGDGRVTRSLV